MRASVMADRFKGGHKTISAPTRFTMLKDKNTRETESYESLLVKEVDVRKCPEYKVHYT